MSISDVIIILRIVVVISWAMAIISLIAQVRTWQILKEISSSLGGFPEVEKARAKREARQMIDMDYVPIQNLEKVQELTAFLSSLEGDKEAKVLAKDLGNLDVVK